MAAKLSRAFGHGRDGLGHMHFSRLIWLMDNGDICTVRSIFSQDPNGRFVEDVPSLDWRDPAPWIGQQRLIRISIGDEQYTSISPFKLPGAALSRRQHSFRLKNCVSVGIR
ncbi:MAG: hypothetical protein CM15mP84_02750 [Cellvibrionales bacterium]|nr:MAG: hypothetical protein CM15mP84_02750 [Cellvibrionales bacterium]